MIKLVRKILQRQFVDVVKITRRVGEDEILEITFNSRADDTLVRVGKCLDFLYGRMLDHNKRVLDSAATLGGAAASDVVKRIK
jgi:hypothetical protein